MKKKSALLVSVRIMNLNFNYMVNRFNSSCKGATFNVAPCHSREYYHVPRGTSVDTSLLNKQEVSEVFNAREIETDISAMLKAGVSPKFVPCENLLTPSSVSYKSEQGELQAAEILTKFSQREKVLEEQIAAAQSAANNSNNNNPNE